MGVGRFIMFAGGDEVSASGLLFTSAGLLLLLGRNVGDGTGESEDMCGVCGDDVLFGGSPMYEGGGCDGGTLSIGGIYDGL